MADGMFDDPLGIRPDETTSQPPPPRRSGVPPPPTRPARLSQASSAAPATAASASERPRPESAANASDTSTPVPKQQGHAPGGGWVASALVSIFGGRQCFSMRDCTDWPQKFPGTPNPDGAAAPVKAPPPSAESEAPSASAAEAASKKEPTPKSDRLEPTAKAELATKREEQEQLGSLITMSGEQPKSKQLGSLITMSGEEDLDATKQAPKLSVSNVDLDATKLAPPPKAKKADTAAPATPEQVEKVPTSMPKKWQWPPWCLDFKSPSIEVFVYDDETSKGRWVKGEPQSRVVDVSGNDAFLCVEYDWDGEYYVEDFPPQHVRKRGTYANVFQIFTKSEEEATDMTDHYNRT